MTPGGDPLAFVVGERVYLRVPRPEDVNDTYLSWLNDPETLRYSARKAFPTGIEEARAYPEAARRAGDLHLAICVTDTAQHVGNISLQRIQWPHGSAVLSILIGTAATRGKGYGKDAIALATRHAFASMGLRRLSAESPHPAFNAAMRSLGWTHEGTRRQALLVDGAYADLECWGILKDEFLNRSR
ncbi:GNAT family N-acetyltransferase [Magnetospirillum sp. UT-4]|uniref:GNAT family N-acetyltransferase n=1 Tax=Magnetospirillum sp. UT-4 TaxID=2681467 RepID=UPI00137C7EFB|nr:GNAT family protein [Magnetospirillum sp. UT-4]CAA7618650.1 Acetyltransferase [Magnetospirillum sp. UT-4]